MLLRFFRQKLLWIGMLILIVEMFVFSWAFLGSTVNPQPSELPVALVSLDQGSGEQIKNQLIEMEGLPIQWRVLDTEQEALDGMTEEEYYGALIISEMFSASLQSIPTADPKPAHIKIYVNQGKHMNGSTAVRQALEAIVAKTNEQMSLQLITKIKQQSTTVPTEKVALLSSPIQTDTIILHPIPANTAGGNVANVLTQLVWLGSIFTTLVVYQAWRKAAPPTANGYAFPLQWLGGAMLLLVVVGILLLTAEGLWGLYVPDDIPLYWTLFLIACCFFLFQSAFINWFGFAGMLAPVLVFFFGLPIINLVPEMLPSWSQDWLYSWIPFRFSSDAIRRLYFMDHTAIVWDALRPLLWYGAVSAAAGWLSIMKKQKSKEKSLQS